MPTLRQEKILTGDAIQADRDADSLIANVLAEALRDYVREARAGQLDLDWTGLSVAIRAVPDYGGSLRVQFDMPAEPVVKDGFAGILNRALADAARGRR